MQIKLTEADYQSTVKTIGRMGKRAKEAAMKEIGATAEDMLADAQMRLRKNNSIAFSNLVNSGRIEKNEDGYTVSFLTSYAWAVEFGRKAGSIVTVEELLSWVKKKLRINNPKMQKTVAYFVSRAIFRFGTKAKPFFYPAYQSSIKGITERIAKAIEYTRIKRTK